MFLICFIFPFETSNPHIVISVHYNDVIMTLFILFI